MSGNQYYSLSAAEEPFGAMIFLLCSRALLLCFGIWIGLSACDASSLPATPPPSSFGQRSAAGLETQGNLKQHQIAFLNRIRKADPQHRTIQRALFNDQNELGLILDRSVELDKISALMRTMLAQMAHEFPNQDLTIIAYAPSNPPRKIGTARLVARTRDMTYMPER